jgi:hypothetical protein
LLVREELDNIFSRTLNCLVSPVGISFYGYDLGDGTYLPHQRAVVGAGTTLWQGVGVDGVPYPNAWVRLRREGGTFYCYRGNNGADWTLISQVTPAPAYPATVYVGTCAAPGTLERSAAVRFRDYVNLVTRLIPPEAKIIDEGATLTLHFDATDPDVPANALQFSLGPGAPEGATINAATGLFAWTPTEAQGPSTNHLTVIVTEDGSPPLTATNELSVIVNEVNTAPVLGAMSDWTVNAGQTISFTATATDVDSPTNSLTFSLLSPPVGAGIDADSGLFTWRPTLAQAGIANLVRVQVTDYNPWAVNAHQLSATQSFRIAVNPLTPVTLRPLGYTNESFRLSVSGPVGPDYILQASPNLHDWLSLASNAPLTLPFTVSDTNTAAFPNRFYRVRLGP